MKTLQYEVGLILLAGFQSKHYISVVLIEQNVSCVSFSAAEKIALDPAHHYFPLCGRDLFYYTFNSLFKTAHCLKGNPMESTKIMSV